MILIKKWVAFILPLISVGMIRAWAVPSDSAQTQWETEQPFFYPSLRAAVTQTHDGDFAIVSGSEGPIRADFRSHSKVIFTLLDQNGKVKLQKKHSITGQDAGLAIAQNPDGSFIVAGYSWKRGYCESILLLKTDSLGNKIWTKSFEWIESDGPPFIGISATAGNGYIIAGTKFASKANGWDFYLLKLDSLGERQWLKHYGGRGHENCTSLAVLEDGGFLLAGSTTSFGSGDSDFWVVRTNANGDSVWSKVYGDSLKEECAALALTPGGFALVGTQAAANPYSASLRLVIQHKNGIRTIDKAIPQARTGYQIASTESGDLWMFGLAGQYQGGDDVESFIFLKTDELGEVVSKKTWTVGTFGGNSVGWVALIATADGRVAWLKYELLQFSVEWL